MQKIETAADEDFTVWYGVHRGLQGYRVTGLQGYRVTGFQGYRVSGLQGFRGEVFYDLQSLKKPGS